MSEEIIINGMKCKPFNLDRAIMGDPVVTRSGLKVTQIVKFDVQGDHEIAGVIDGRLYSWRNNGERFSFQSEIDLFMAPVKKIMYCNIFKSDDGYIYTGNLHDNPDAADGVKMAAGCRIARATVTWEE